MGHICAGYYYDPGSGYYYDANSGLYFDSASQQWLALDPETGQFSAPQQPDTAPSTAVESSIGSSVYPLACNTFLLVTAGVKSYPHSCSRCCRIIADCVAR